MYVCMHVCMHARTYMSGWRAGVSLHLSNFFAAVACGDTVFAGKLFSQKSIEHRQQQPRPGQEFNYFHVLHIVVSRDTVKGIA